MKKQLFWILPFVVLIFIIIIYTQVPFIYRFWFNVRHVLVYGLSIYLLLFGSYLIFRYIQHTKIHRTIQITIMSLIGIAILGFAFVVSEFQVQYIDLYEVPPLEGCSYYDHYGNILYTTQYPAICPELEQIEQRIIDGENKLSFVVEEHYTGPAHMFISVDGFPGLVEYDLDVTLSTTVNITYYNKSYIKEYSSSSFETQNRSQTDYDFQETFIRIYRKNVVNDYSDSVITTNVSTYNREASEAEFFSSQYPPPGLEEESFITYTSTMYQEDDINYVDISKTSIVDEEEETSIFLRGEYRDVNDPLFMLDFYEDDRFTGNTFDAYFDYGSYSFASETSYNQWAGVEDTTERREVTFIDTPNIFYDYTENIDVFMFDSFHLESYRNTLSNFDRSTDYRESKDVIYAIEDNKISKFFLTDYGFKVEDYSTIRYSNGSYHQSLDQPKSVLIRGLYDFSNSSSLENLYNYEEMLYYPAILSNYHFYQHNPLLEGYFIFK